MEPRVAKARSRNHCVRLSSMTTDKSIILPGEYPSLRFESPADDPIEKLNLDDIFQEKYLERRHFDFILPDLKYEGKHAVISVLAKPTSEGPDQIYPCLLTTAKGYSEFPLLVKAGPDSLLSRITQSLKDINKTDNITYVVKAQEFEKDLATVEQKHPQNRTAMKIGVLYIQQGESLPKKWFTCGTPNGPPCDPRFWKLMDGLGTKTDLTGFTGYLGDMGKKGTSYTGNWKDVELMYHVSPMLTPEEHRRLVGNDIALLFFVEEGAPLDLSGLGGLGTVGQVYVAVQPAGDLWRLAFFCNNAIKEHFPRPPPNPVPFSALKDLILTRLFNGLCVTIYAGSVSRLWYIPRSEHLEGIIAQYPPLNPKELKAYEKAKREEFTMQLSLKDSSSNNGQIKGERLQRIYA